MIEPLSQSALLRTSLYLELIDHYIDTGLWSEAEEYCRKVKNIMEPAT